ncbi:MAG TPA: PAS domain-containing protein [Dissulfurispiraceae bacterium]|nr:PAS domain-containing protein [Dissulfurispiraceae bacterium]
MNDPERTIAELTGQVERLRRRIAELESPGAGEGHREEELRASLLRQNAILNNIPDIAWLKDRESRFIAVNGPFGEACGVAPADLVGKTDYDIWPRATAPTTRR